MTESASRDRRDGVGIQIGHKTAVAIGSALVVALASLFGLQGYTSLVKGPNPIDVRTVEAGVNRAAGDQLNDIEAELDSIGDKFGSHEKLPTHPEQSGINDQLKHKLAELEKWTIQTDTRLESVEENTRRSAESLSRIEVLAETAFTKMLEDRIPK